MNTYRGEHQPHRHDHRDAAHGHFHEPVSEEDLQLAQEELAKLQRQLEIADGELVEAAVQEVENRCFHILSRTDDGTLPEVVISLKAALQDAKGNYMR